MYEGSASMVSSENDVSSCSAVTIVGSASVTSGISVSSISSGSTFFGGVDGVVDIIGLEMDGDPAGVVDLPYFVGDWFSLEELFTAVLGGWAAARGVKKESIEDWVRIGAGILV